jgi:hypothetical protein
VKPDRRGAGKGVDSSAEERLRAEKPALRAELEWLSLLRRPDPTDILHQRGDPVTSDL